MKKTMLLLVYLLMLVSLPSYCQTVHDSLPAKPALKWFEKISLKGYVQVRYNRLLETNPNLRCDQCDKSWGNNGGFFLRRIRIAFSGKLNDYVSFYIQPDFATNIDAKNNTFGQIRDAYMDVYLDKKNEFRFRIGQSKVPYGYENIQSSANRLPLDRDDALNSAVPNERDLGVFFSWAPESKRKLMSHLGNSLDKGTGDYGVIAFGAYNGQSANQSEANNTRHWVARISYPFELNMGTHKQILEPGIQAYTGKFVLLSKTATVTANANLEYTDERVAGSLVLLPNPIGLQMEYNVGRGPEYNKITNTIDLQNLKGGYAILSYMIKTKKELVIYPFIRYQVYEGGKKQELDARSYNVKEFEIGIEWQISKALEFVTQYTISERRFEDGVLTDNFQKGSLLRLQAQVNF
ncbi:MAG TPA: porin [Saprospiraceae bacterium]|nr:porin [Saprospiraceae bacterium]